MIAAPNHPIGRAGRATCARRRVKILSTTPANRVWLIGEGKSPHIFRLASEVRLRNSVCGVTIAAIFCAACLDSAAAQSTSALPAARCAPTERIGRITEIRGNIFVSRSAGSPLTRIPAGPGPTLVSTNAGMDGYDVCAGEVIVSGARSRATVELLIGPGAAAGQGAGQTIRIDQNSELQISRAPTQDFSLLGLARGFIRVFNPIGRRIFWQTATRSGGTEGTEFFVSVANPQSQDELVTVGVTEGVVGVQPRLPDSAAIYSRAAGQQALSCDRASATDSCFVNRDDVFDFPRGRAPVRSQLTIAPTDRSVRWAIYYPAAVWQLPAAEEAQLNPAVRDAWEAWRSGNLDRLGELLGGVSTDSNAPALPVERLMGDDRSLIRFASLLLTFGRVEEAEAALGYVRSPSPIVPALRSIIAVAQNQTARALELSEDAVTRAGADPVACVDAGLARSYALQADFRLSEARGALTEACIASAGDPLVDARLAELDFSLGDNSRARDEVSRAVAAAPRLSRPHAILGLLLIANYQFEEAEQEFVTAANLDSSDPLPHLGLGLRAIRAGGFLPDTWRRNLETARREMTLAAVLDPADAVARSNLGRAYAAADLDVKTVRDQAFEEWRLAETADPRDPTAPLYRAFAERALNRPVEALGDVQASIARNQNRAVYRSQLLLDQDQATRGTDLAAVHRELGFDQLALSEAYQAVNTDPANPAAHRFLSDTYLGMPRHETASDSELLQSQLLQPINTQPVRPELARESLGILDLQGPFRIGLNEFSPLFVSNGLNLLTDAFGGNRGTYGGNLVVSGIQDRFSFSAGQFYYRTEGIRPNDGLRRDIENVFVQAALSDRASIFGEFRHSGFTGGDNRQLFDPDNFSPTDSNITNTDQYRVGGRFDAAPGVILAGVWTRENLSGDLHLFDGFIVDANKELGDLAEAAAYIAAQRFDAVAGASYFTSDTTDNITVDGDPEPASYGHVSHLTLWGYATTKPLERLQITVGSSADFYNSSSLDRNRISPKAGIVWDAVPGLALRAAYIESLKRRLVGGQTIEPTQVAGFNQLFDDINITSVKLWGIGADHTINPHLFLGAEWTERRLWPPDLNRPWVEQVARSYVNWAINENIVANIGLQWSSFEHHQGVDTVDEASFERLNFTALPIELRFFGGGQYLGLAPGDTLGLFGFLRASLVYETGDFYGSDLTLSHESNSFAVVDAGLGWRIPGRPAVASIQVANVLNSSFRFQSIDLANPQFVPHRTVIGRVTFNL